MPTSSNYTYIGENQTMWRSKKHNVVSRPNAKAEYRVVDLSDDVVENLAMGTWFS